MCPRPFLTILTCFVGLLSLQAAPMPLTDAQGNPMPNGATARIGTVRLRHNNKVKSMTFTPDGKRLISTDGSLACDDTRLRCP